MKFNKSYEEARNKLIPEAEKHADLIAGSKPGKTDDQVIDERNLEGWAGKWNFAFNARMNELMEKVDPVCEKCGMRLW